MRYVFHTTGPYAMNRFLRLPANAATLERMKFVECKYFKDAESLNENGKRVFDVISYQSQSYFTTEHEIRVQVGLGDLELPPLPTSKRMRVKSGVRRMCVSNGGEDGAKGPAMLDKDCVEAPSRDKTAAPSEVVAATGVDADAIVKFLTDLVADLLIDCMTSAVERVDREATQDRHHMNQIKAYVKRHKKCAATKVMLQDMPQDLVESIMLRPNL